MPWKDSRFKIEVVENRRVGGKNMLLFLWHYETYRNHTIQISFKRHAILQLRYILKKQQNEEISSKVIAHPSKYTNHVGGENFEHQLGWMFSEKFKIIMHRCNFFWKLTSWVFRFTSKLEFCFNAWGAHADRYDRATDPKKIIDP